MRKIQALPWHRLIMLQIIIGCLLISVCAYYLRIPGEQVRIVSNNELSLDMMSGMPMKVEVSYPGLGTVSIDDPKELLQFKNTFQELLASGSKERISKPANFTINGVMYYLDQDAIPFVIDAESFTFNDEYVSSLNISATIRKLQSYFIDKLLTQDMIVTALNTNTNQVGKLIEGKLEPLSQSDRLQLTMAMGTATRVIDFSPITQLKSQSIAHYVLQLNDSRDNYKHWLHIDAYSSGYFVIYDLLDETNHHAYFKLDGASGNDI